MKNAIVILLVLMVADAFYFLGKKNGEGQTNVGIYFFANESLTTNSLLPTVYL